MAMLRFCFFHLEVTIRDPKRLARLMRLLIKIRGGLNEQVLNIGLLS